MFAIQKMIDSRFPRLFATCALSLCLALPALDTAASSTNPAARADDLRLPLISSFVDPEEILLPKPPPLPIPPPYQGTTATEHDLRLPLISSFVDPEEILLPKPPPLPIPPPYHGTMAMEQTA